MFPPLVQNAFLLRYLPPLLDKAEEAVYSRCPFSAIFRYIISWSIGGCSGVSEERRGLEKCWVNDLEGFVSSETPIKLYMGMIA